MRSSDNHRHCFLLIGSINEILSDFLHLCEHLSAPLICAHDVTEYNQLNTSVLDDSSIEIPSFRTCSFKQVRQELGSTHDAILVDLTHGVSAQDG
jgi:tRNA(Met) cytidine acetyltransferase